MQLLNRHTQPFVVFTKSAMIAEDDYPELLTGAHASAQSSLSTLDAEIARALLAELSGPGSSPPDSRREAGSQP